MAMNCARRTKPLLQHLLVAMALALLAVTFSGPASGQTPRPDVSPQRQKAAAEAFHLCREMESHGDATSCWKLWLEKHREAGSEAEIMVAEERVGAAKPRPAPPPPAPAPPPPADEDNPYDPLASDEEKAKLAAELELAEEREGTAKERGSSDEHWRDFDRDWVDPVHRQGPAKPVDPRGTAVPSGSVGIAKGGVLDFCALAPRQDAARFVKQRVVMFAPVGAEAIEKDGKIRAAEGATHLRDVFLARFALQRFHNVLAGFPADATWVQKRALPLSEVRDYVTDHGSEEEADFVAYSIACADYVVVPAITGHTVRWQDVEVKTSKGKQKVKVLDLEIESQLAIFHRAGGTLVRIALLDATAPSFMDRATDMAAATTSEMTKMPGMDLVQAADTALDLPAHISALPRKECVIATATEGAAGLAKCGAAGAGSGSVAQTLGSIDERLGPFCQDAKSDTESVACEVRVRAFQLTRALQTKARDVDGWRLSAPLQIGTADDPKASAVSLGDDEGLKIGYGMRVLGPDGGRLAYFKVTDLGPGGQAGIADPSELSLRMGNASEGATVEEFAQAGISLLPHFTFAGLLNNSGAATITQEIGKSVYETPSSLIGGGAQVGYDLSPAIGLVETHLRVGASALYGAGVGIDMLLLPIDLTIEKGFYLGPYVTLFFALGGSASFASLSLVETKVVEVPTESLSAWLGGMIGRMGFDLLVHPSVSLRLDAAVRVHFNSASYTDQDGNVPVPELAAREDRHSSVGLNFGTQFLF